MQTVTLKLTAAIAVAGQIIKPAKPGERPTLIEVTTSEAKDLLRRGKAVLATIGDVEEIVVAGAPVATSGTQESPLHPDIAAHQEDREQQKAEAAAEVQAEAQAAADANTDALTVDATPVEADKVASRPRGRNGRGAAK